MSHDQRAQIYLWRGLPFVKVGLVFVPGLALGIECQAPPGVLFACVLLLAACAVQRVIHMKARHQAVALYLACFLAGCLVGSDYGRSRAAIAQWTLDPQDDRSWVVTDAQIASYGQKVEARLSRVCRGHTIYKPPKAVLYIRGEGLSPKLNIGDTLKLSRIPQRIAKHDYPLGFDSHRYYLFRGVGFRDWLGPDDYSVGRADSWSVTALSARLRGYCQGIIDNRIAEPRSRAILSAMLLGNKTHLDDSVLSAFKRSGAMHVLAISGLHIGIMASLLYLVIGRPSPQQSRRNAIIKCTAMIGGIWVYVMVSGSAPSAVRAASMFSLYIIGIVISRRSPALNILAFTAIAFLVLDPGLLLNIGFQLSYLALCGILVFTRPLQKLVNSGYKAVRLAWSVIAVSLAAQSLIIPVLLLNFHEISLISFLTSLVAIPAAYLLVSSGVLMLITDTIAPILSMVVAKGLDVTAVHLTGILGFTADLPVSHVHNVYLSPVEFLVLLSLGIAFAMRVFTMSRRWTAIAFGIAAIFAACHVSTVLTRKLDPSIVFYPCRAGPCMDVFGNGAPLTTVRDGDLSDFEFQAVKESRMREYSRDQPRNVVRSTMYRFDNLVVTHGIIPDTCHGITSRPADRVLAYVDKPAAIRANQLMEYGGYITPDIVILDPNIRYAQKQGILRICDSLNIPVHDLRERGSIKIPLTNENNARIPS